MRQQDMFKTTGKRRGLWERLVDGLRGARTGYLLGPTHLHDATNTPQSIPIPQPTTEMAQRAFSWRGVDPHRPTTARMDNPATQKPDKPQQTRSQPRQAKSPPHCAAGSTESKVNTTTATPTPEALAIAVIFKDFAIDHTPDGWPAVKQMHLSAAAAELERQHAEIQALRALLSKKPIIGSGRTQYDRLIKAVRNIEQSVNSSSSWGRCGPDDSDIAWQEFMALASDVCTLIDSPPDNEALKAVQEAVREALHEAKKACENLPAPESCSGVERSLWGAT